MYVRDDDDGDHHHHALVGLGMSALESGETLEIVRCSFGLFALEFVIYEGGDGGVKFVRLGVMMRVVVVSMEICVPCGSI